MFVKVNEFEQAVATPVAAPVAAPARGHAWPNAVHGLAGLAFLTAWLPITLLCWALFGTMIALKIGVDACQYLGRVLLGDRGAR